jgi:hypothetical protein
LDLLLLALVTTISQKKSYNFLDKWKKSFYPAIKASEEELLGLAQNEAIA